MIVHILVRILIDASAALALPAIAGIILRFQCWAKGWGEHGPDGHDHRLWLIWIHDKSLKSRLYVILMTGFATRRQVERYFDDIHFRGAELEEHRRTLRSLKSVPGDRAQDERERLVSAITELERWEVEVDGAAGDAYIASIHAELDALHALRSDWDTALLKQSVTTLNQLV